MPAIVDHDARRVEIAAAVGRLVAHSGIRAVTIREVAKEAGFSAAIIGHYFQDKDDLLRFTYLNARNRTNLRVERALLAGKNVFDCLGECLPTDTAQRTDWMVWFGLWGMDARSAPLAEERRNGLLESSELFHRVLRAGIQRGELPSQLDVRAQAERLQIFINGIASLAVQIPNRMPAAAQRRLLAAELDIIRRL